MAEEDGAIKRWSRRKLAARRPAAAAPVPDAAGTGQATEGAAPAPDGATAQTAPDAVDPATLPPVESLGPGSDFAAFLRKGVPEALRNAALRRLYMTDPFISTFKEVADYDWDFNAPGAGALWPTDDVAAMLRNLHGHLADGAAPGQVPAEPAGDGPPTEALVQPVPDVPAEAPGGEPRAEPRLLGVAAPLVSTEMPADDAAAPTRRRHGGALPS